MNLRTYSSPELLDLGSIATMTAATGGGSATYIFFYFVGDPSVPQEIVEIPSGATGIGSVDGCLNSQTESALPNNPNAPNCDVWPEGTGSN